MRPLFAEVGPIINVVAAPNAFTVVAVVLNTANVALLVVTLVVNCGLVENTSKPEPVSSEIMPANCDDVVEANWFSPAPVYATVPPAPKFTELASVPVNVNVLLTVNVLALASVNVAGDAGVVMVTLL